MKTKDLKANQAIVVDAKGITEIQDGDIVLVGVKSVYKDGQFIPIIPSLKLVQNVFDYCDEGELYILKRFK